MPYVSDLLTAAAASVVGTPTPTRSWQWLRGSTLISGATSSTYTVSEDDIGSAISVRQIESNIAGVATATSAATAAVQAFEPIALFQSGEEGAWYDPSDLATLYQDSAGTTPVTAAGQPVGLMLDKSKGLTLGSELVTNGTFDTDTTGWSGYQATLSAASGSLVATATVANDSRVSTPIPVVPGKFYKISGSVISTSAGSINVGYNETSGSIVFSITGLISTTAPGGSFVGYVIATNTNLNLVFRSSSLAIGQTFAIDNISVKELPGNHATQSTSTARPTLQVTGTTPATLGSELVTNGTFDDSSGWTLGPGWSVSSGAATHSGSTSGTLSTTLSVVSGRTYRIEFTTSGRTTSQVNFQMATGGATTEVFSANGTYVRYYVAGSAGNIVFNGVTTFDGSIDNVSVKEVLTWADPKYYLDFDGVDDFIRTTNFASAQAQPNTMAAGIKLDAPAGNNYIIDGINSLSRHLFYTGGGENRYYAGASIVAGPATSNPSIWLAEFNLSSSSLRLDGSLVSSGANVSTKNWDGINLGSSYAPGFWADCRIYGFVGVNRTLTTAEIEATESYLATKSGVTLP